jgi:hypothetical protein
LALAAGCLFEPRHPESGSGGGVCFDPVTAIHEDAVFVNLEGALRCKIGGTYVTQLSDNFLFKPAASVAQDYPSVFADPWDKARETNFINTLLSRADSVSADLNATEVPGTRNGSDPVSFEASYVFRYVPVGGSATKYEGHAIYTLATEGRTTFSLVEWEELEPGTGQTALGTLRGALATQ